MKTSNYIILSFFTCLFGGIFILFLAAKIDPRAELKREFVTDEKLLDNFSVIVAEQGANINIKTGEVSKIGLYYHKGDTCVLPDYLVRNDTLFVKAHPAKNKYWATVIVCKQVHSIEGKEKSQIHLEQYPSDSLSVSLNNSEFKCFPEKNSTCSLLQLTANNSRVSIARIRMNNLDLQLRKTHIDAWQNHIGNLSGKLTENSNISLGGVDKISLEADSTSTYRLEK